MGDISAESVASTEPHPPEPLLVLSFSEVPRSWEVHVCLTRPLHAQYLSTAVRQRREVITQQVPNALPR